VSAGRVQPWAWLETMSRSITSEHRRVDVGVGVGVRVDADADVGWFEVCPAPRSSLVAGRG
jgi:hypothetical protein